MRGGNKTNRFSTDSARKQHQPFASCRPSPRPSPRKRGEGAADLSPLPWRCGRLRASLPATGRECTPFFTWQRPAPGRRALRKARDPGGPGRPVAASRQQWWRSRCPSKDSRLDPRSSSGGGAGEPKIGPGQKSPPTRAPHGDPGDLPRSRGALKGLSRRPGRVSWGRRTTGPRVAERRLRTRRTPASPPGRTARGPGRGDQHHA